MAWTTRDDERLLELLRAGHTAASAAREMGVSETTAKRHRQRLRDRGYDLPSGKRPLEMPSMSDDPEVLAENRRRNWLALNVGFNWLERNARDGRVWLGGERVPVGKAACDMLEELHRWAVAQRRAAYEVDARKARVGEVA